MLIEFFQKLKQGGVPVSVREFLTLLEALDKRVISGSIDDFYYLSRACLVKDESNYDKFDRVFGAYFKGIVELPEGAEALIPEEWLKKLAEKTGITGHREYNGGWHTTIDLPNMLAVSEMIATAAIERKESRGGHFRDDYPEKRDEYSKFNIRIQKAADGGLKVERVPVKPLPAELQQVIEENK